jgi:hypothetical protein
MMESQLNGLFDGSNGNGKITMFSARAAESHLNESHEVRKNCQEFPSGHPWRQLRGRRLAEWVAHGISLTFAGKLDTECDADKLGRRMKEELETRLAAKSFTPFVITRPTGCTSK